MDKQFQDKLAFSKNLGWLTEEEQLKISHIRVGLIGVGGVGGVYAEALARLGVTQFVICDHDFFSIENTNRQNECKTSTYGKNKAEVISNLIVDINPNAKVIILPGPMKREDINRFVNQIDIYLDTLDFFEIDLRIEIFKKVQEEKKIAISSAPIGTGASTIIFDSNTISFSEYFGFHKTTDHIDRSLQFIIGIAPSLQQLKYIAEKDRANFSKRQLPSLGIGVLSCAAATCSNFMKIALSRGPVLRAPWTIHYDPYLNKIKKTYMWMGYKNPIQRLKILFLKFLITRPKNK